MRLLLFILIELVLLPCQILAILFHIHKLLRRTNPAGISGTANKVIDTRVIMHVAGTRQDEASAKIYPHLPAYGPFVAWAFASFGLAARWSGYDLSWAKFPVERPSNIDSMVNHRSEFFDRTLAAVVGPTGYPPVRQAVIMGAGWDCRAWDPLVQAGFKTFEVDMPITQAAKKRAVEAAGLPLDNVSFIETDFVQKTWLQALTKAGFDAALPTYFLWEGVTMYLTAEAVEVTLAQIARLAPGSLVAFDYLAHEFVHAEAPFEKLGKRAQMGMKFFPNEIWRYGISIQGDPRENVRELLEGQGLCLAGYEPFGPEEEPFGGLALGVVRER